VPVLARILEAAGLATVLVTNMPYWAERVGAPRTLAVEFPFGSPLGYPRDVAQQRRVILAALELLSEAASPGASVHSAESWPVAASEAIKNWQPERPSPIIQHLAPRFREMLRRGRAG